MDVALIAPTKFLPELCGRRPIHMALAHRVLEDPEYRRFYVKLKTPAYVIMDNSMMELGDAATLEDLIAAANLILPDEVILPDAFRDKDTTIKRFLTAIESSHRFTWRYNFAVAHGRNQSEWVECFDFFNDAVEAYTIGLPKVLDEIWHPGGRLGATEFLERTDRIRSDKNYHLLGIWTDPIEVLLQSRHSWIRSVDSALPIHAGMAGVQFGPMGLNGMAKPRRPHRYFPVDSLKYPEIVDRNIRILDGWAKGDAWNG